MVGLVTLVEWVKPGGAIVPPGTTLLTDAARADALLAQFPGVFGITDQAPEPEPAEPIVTEPVTRLVWDSEAQTYRADEGGLA